MDPFEELVEQLREIGRQEVPCSPDFTARTMARLAAIRPFGVPAEPLPAPKPLWRTWWGAASAAAVVLVAVAAWAIPHIWHRQGRADTAPATNNIFPEARETTTSALEGRRNDEPAPAGKAPDALPSSASTVDTDAQLSAPTAPMPNESARPEHKEHYAPDPCFVAPDQRRHPTR